MWLQIVGFVVSLALSYVLRPKPNEPTPASFEQADIPTIKEGTPIAVLFGTREIKAPMVLWHGDFSVDKVQKKNGKK